MGAVTQITILDGLNVARTVDVWSDDGTPAGRLNWLQALLGPDTVNLVATDNRLPISSAPPYAATALGFQQITSLDSAAVLTVPASATFALISCAGGNVSWRDDGTAPTSSIGMFIYDAQPPQLFSGNLSVVKFIKAGSSPKLNVSYYS